MNPVDLAAIPDGALVTDQQALFETDRERRQREHQEALDAAFERVREPGGWRCPTCGQLFENRYHLATDGYPQDGIRPFGTWCWRLVLCTNHAVYALRTSGDVWSWAQATAVLREIAVWRRSDRRRDLVGAVAETLR